MTEDEFSGYAFTSLNFQDTNFGDKLYTLVSSSVDRARSSPRSKYVDFDKNKKDPVINFGQINKNYGAGRSSKSSIQEESTNKKAHDLNAATDKEITGEFISVALNQQREGFIYHASVGKQLKEKDIFDIENVSFHFQLNSKFAHDLVANAMNDPTTTFSVELAQLSSFANTLQQRARNNDQHGFDEEDYKTVINYVSAVSAKSTDVPTTKVVGYVIEKREIFPNGNSKYHAPIVIDNPYASSAVDFRVKYGAKYEYAVKTIVEVRFPTVGIGTNKPILVTALVSSKRSISCVVDCVEISPPPSPADFMPVWDYERSKLVLTWAFPVNTQRDIKKFQVFRRKTVKLPFELLVQIDFDDSAVPADSEEGEQPDPELVEVIESPVTFFVDSEFTKDSKYIYALCSVDAHGFSSAYSQQFELSFDRFKNVLNKKLLSPSGAPKSYPNSHLSAEPFLDVVYMAGSKVVKLVFEPEYLSLKDSHGRLIPIIATDKTGGKYQFQFMNIDLAQQQTVEVSIQDLRTSVKKDEKTLPRKQTPGTKSRGSTFRKK